MEKEEKKESVSEVADKVIAEKNPVEKIQISKGFGKLLVRALRENRVQPLSSEIRAWAMLEDEVLQQM